MLCRMLCHCWSGDRKACKHLTQTFCSNKWRMKTAGELVYPGRQNVVGGDLLSLMLLFRDYDVSLKGRVDLTRCRCDAAAGDGQ